MEQTSNNTENNMTDKIIEGLVKHIGNTTNSENHEEATQVCFYLLLP